MEIGNSQHLRSIDNDLYDQNVSGSVALFECMMEAVLRTIVLLSSAQCKASP